MNYSWLEDVKVQNVGQLKPHCFYSFDPALRLSLNGTWQTKHLSKVSSPFSDDFQKIEWSNCILPSKIDLNPSPYSAPDSEKKASQRWENYLYKTTFGIKPQEALNQHFINFEHVSGISYYWLNGDFLGFNKSKSIEIEFDVSSIIKSGENELIVQIFQDVTSLYKTPTLGSICLYSLPEKYIRDYHISTSWSELNGAAFDLSVDLIGDANVEVTIYENDHPILIKDCLKNLSVKNLFLESWSFEYPKLYLLELCVIDQSGVILQTMTQYIGFRSIEIVNGLLYLNGKYLCIKGINRSAPYGQLSMINDETMLLDIRMLKAANINTVINFDHPHRQKWYELCDKYGILIIDHVPAQKSSDALLRSAEESENYHLANVKSMFHRSKNHTCVIGWHIGTENNFNLDTSFHWIKSKERKRLVLLSQERPKGHSDVYCPSYLNVDQLSAYVYSNPSKPLILSKIDNAFGNSLGGLKTYWDFINNNDCLQGGFVDGFIDGGIKTSDGKWDYDSKYDVKGILLPDRTPHPTYFELKKIFQEIVFRIDQEEQLIVFRNNNLFEPIIGVIEIRIWEAKQQLFFQRRNFELPAQASELITYNLDNNKFSDSVFLDVRCFMNNGELAGEEQFILHRKTAEIPSSKRTLVFPFVIAPNLRKLPSQMEDEKKNILENPPQYELTEDYIDEDTLCIQLKCQVTSPLPRFGVKIQLPKIYSQVSYLGRGPHENYSDRKSSAFWGQYYTTPEKMIPSYIIPQESGYRSENEEIVITDLHGNGFRFTSILPFGFSYSPYDFDQYKDRSTFPKTKAGLVESDHYILCIDRYMNGIGGVLSSEDESIYQKSNPENYAEFTLYISAV